MGKEAILQDLLCAELVPPMYQRDVGRMVREVKSFLDRGVAAADDDDLLPAVKEAIATRAIIAGQTWGGDSSFGR